VTRVDLAQDDRESERLRQRTRKGIHSRRGTAALSTQTSDASAFGSQVERQTLRSEVGGLEEHFNRSAAKRRRELLKTDGDKAGTVPPGGFGEQPQGS